MGQQDTTRPDHRDGVIETLAASEAWLLERVVDLTTERDAYRAVAHQAVHALHSLTAERDRLRISVRVLLERGRSQASVAA
jgi:hypothetical protein